VEELAAQILEQAHRGGSLDDTPPAAVSPIQHRPHQRQARALTGEAADHPVLRRVSPKVVKSQFVV
jgi:hypothetical protein